MSFDKCVKSGGGGMFIAQNVCVCVDAGVDADVGVDVEDGVCYILFLLLFQVNESLVIKNNIHLFTHPSQQFHSP